MAIARDYDKFMREYAWSVGVGVVIGAVLKELISALVDDLIMPLVELLTGVGKLEGWTVKVGGTELLMGHLVGRFVYFVVVALILFLIVRYVIGIRKYKK